MFSRFNEVLIIVIFDIDLIPWKSVLYDYHTRTEQMIYGIPFNSRQTLTGQETGGAAKAVDVSVMRHYGDLIPNATE